MQDGTLQGTDRSSKPFDEMCVDDVCQPHCLQRTSVRLVSYGSTCREVDVGEAGGTDFNEVEGLM